MSRPTDALIIGGGLAGAAAACELARAGRRAVLLERDDGPSHKVCGEFLGGVALRELSALGIDVGTLGAAPIDRMRLVRGTRIVEAKLPFAGAGLSRRILDDVLLERAAIAGAEVRRGVQVDQLDTSCHRTRATLLATGKHDIRGARRSLDREPDPFVGFKMHLRLSAAQADALAGCVELVLFDDAYVGLQRIDHAAANLCLLADRARLAAAGGTWAGLRDNLLAASAHLRVRFDGATELLDKPLAIARVPYGFVHTSSGDDDLFRLGDQLGVIPSFCGEGMAIALHSGRAAGRCIAEAGTAPAFHARMRRDISRQIRRATTLQRIGRTRFGQAGLMHVASLCPPLLSLFATSTRVG